MFRRARRSLPLRAVLTAAAALVVAAVPGAFDAAVYRRTDVLSGEAWRLLSMHFVHAGPTHLRWDVLPLLGIGLLFEEVLVRRWWLALGVSAACVGSGLVLFDPTLGTYCGLSGVENGLWVSGALLAARAESRSGHQRLAAIYRIAVVAGLAKIAIEVASGTSLFLDSADLQGVPIPLSHALGALGGALVTLMTPGDPELTA